MSAAIAENKEKKKIVFSDILAGDARVAVIAMAGLFRVRQSRFHSDVVSANRLRFR